MNRLACAALLAIAACGPPPAPRAPTGSRATVRAEIDRAEDAERARQHEVARAHYEAAVAAARDPADVHLAHREFADTLASWGEAATAAKQLEAAVAAVPDQAADWHDLGFLRFNAGDVPGALTALERAKQLAPDDPRPRLTLAVIKWKRGDRAGAAAEYRGLLGLQLDATLRAKVQWALDQLAKPPRDSTPAAPQPPT